MKHGTPESQPGLVKSRLYLEGREHLWEVTAMLKVGF
ncbi:hypothetical protein SAMN05518672_108109 [Chitinophaga sp. CF118]|nr:hypothetical protein SAMN05518672_108109 [Chitinophaga sp. CF118]